MEGSSNESSGCCDICSVDPVTYSSRLNIFSAAKVNRRKHRRAVRTLSSDLEKKLKLAREEFLNDHPAFRMVGTDFLCPDSSISKLCQEAKYIESMEDFSTDIRSELKDIFFSVVVSCSLSSS